MRNRLVAVLTVSCPMATGCPKTEDPEKEPSPTDDTASDDTAQRSIEGSASVAPNPDNQFSALVLVTVEEDAEVVVRYGSDELDHETPPVSVAAGVETVVVVLGLRAGTEHRIMVEADAGDGRYTSEELSYTTAPLPVGWPVCTPRFTAPQQEFDEDEALCFAATTTAGESAFICTDYWGEPVFELRTEDGDNLQSARPLTDGSWASVAQHAESLVLFDRLGRTTAVFDSAFFQGKTRHVHQQLDHHEVFELTQGSWQGALVFLTNSVDEPASGGQRVAQGIIVFDPLTEEVLYDVSLHGEPGDGLPLDPRIPYDRNDLGDGPQDWTHANSVVHGADADGREWFLMSLKSQNWVVKIYPDDDEIGWLLGNEGDFVLVDDLLAGAPVEVSPLEWFYQQHGIEVLGQEDSLLHLMLLDNGVPRYDGSEYRQDIRYSRALFLDVDEASLRADVVWEYGARKPGDGHFLTTKCGNTQLPPSGDRLIAVDADDHEVFEVGYPGGEERWSMSCDNEDLCTYRVSWFPSLYETGWIYE